MLLLGRYIGESIQLGEIRVTVLDIVNHQAKLRIGSDVFHLSKNEKVNLGGDVVIILANIFSNRQVRIGIEAPRSVKILRTELVEVSP